MHIKDIERYISKVPDFPKKGILFYDVSTLISNNLAFRASIDQLSRFTSKYEYDLIAGIDARGFIFASALASGLNKGMVMIRKENKLPGDNKIHIEYELEYGKDVLEANINLQNKKILLVDDLLATGGTAKAAVKLIEKSGGKPVCFISLIELDFLSGRKNIEIPIETLIHY